MKKNTTPIDSSSPRACYRQVVGAHRRGARLLLQCAVRARSKSGTARRAIPTGAWGHLLACGFASFVLLAATVLAADNLAVNGGFDDGTNGWQFQWRTGPDTPAENRPEQLAIVTPKEGGNLLRITIPEVTEAGLHEAHSDGATLKLVSSIPEGSKLLVRLKARSVSGASCLTIDRCSAGASGIIAQLGGSFSFSGMRVELDQQGASTLQNPPRR